MPNTKITKQKFKDHWSYSKKIYIIGALVAMLVCNLLFSVTRYQVPNERSVQIALVDAYTAPDKLDDIVPALLQAGQENDDTLEMVSFSSIGYSGDPNSSSENDYYGAQLYMVQIVAGDNDFYIQNEHLTRDLINQSYCYPLETLEAFEEFTRRYPDVNILYAPERYASDDETLTDEELLLDGRPQHAYAIDISSLTGMAERGAYNNAEKYASLVLTSANPETSFDVFLRLFDLLSTPAEDAQ